MCSHLRSRVSGAALSLLLAGAGAATGCAGNKSESKAPQSAAAAAPAPAPQAASPTSKQPNAASSGAAASPSANGEDDEDNAELVVSRDVVARCPKLRLVRQHVAEFDPDMVWLAVLESLGECMGEGGPMAELFIGVSGDEEHRHVVREVLGTRGVAPTRVVATPTSPAGAAECQGGGGCSKRVEITIAPGP